MVGLPLLPVLVSPHCLRGGILHLAYIDGWLTWCYHGMTVSGCSPHKDLYLFANGVCLMY